MLWWKVPFTCSKRRCQYERAQVPGVLEIPVAIAYAAQTGKYDGYVALGVVIRGETTHYDIVCGESARGLNLSVRDCLAIGNGIQTVENEQQAWARCKLWIKTKAVAQQKRH